MSKMLVTLGVGKTSKKDSAVKQYFKDRATKKGAKGKGTGGGTGIDHQELIQKKIEQVKKELSSSAGYKFTLPGTDPNQQRPMSKAVEQALERIAQKRLQKEKKKAKDAVLLAPRNFGGAVGGKMDSRGRVMDSSGKIILTVDKDTGKIRNNNGMVVGKYNPESNYNGFQMEKLIAKYSLVGKGPVSLMGGPAGFGVAPPDPTAGMGIGQAPEWAPEPYAPDFGPGAGFWGDKND